MLAAMRSLGAGLMIALLVGAGGCADPLRYAAGAHYESPKPIESPTPMGGLISAHATHYGQPGGADDVLVLVFASEVDPLGLVAEAFGVVRTDGQRVQPTQARLGPADEGDENRSVLLVGDFGELAAEPIAAHVLGRVFGESGESFEGFDVAISPLASADRLLVLERLGPLEGRCLGAQQVLRTYWSDALAGVGADDLATIELMLADGTRRSPIDFDDQATRSEDPSETELGPADDNVLDLCIDVTVPVVRLRIPAGQFTDLQGHPTAAAEVGLAAT